MDVQQPSRERIFSILNGDSNPSFTHKVRQTSPRPRPTLPSISSFTSLSHRRPSLSRHPQFNRNHSVSSAGSPPLLRYDSSASSKSNSSMDNSPSPTTPAYLHGSVLAPYDGFPQQSLGPSYLPTPTNMTPFMEQSMMITPNLLPSDVMAAKSMPHMPVLAPAVPSSMYPMSAAEYPSQLDTPALSVSTTSPVSNAAVATSPTTSIATTAATATKKNKYPCPFASSHNCTASFTTSGHAARHGKKHTGEKNIECPVCKKAFTRKDNMKQHERTHKNGAEGGSRKSKAQVTREAQKEKEDQERLALIAPAPAPTANSQPQMSAMPSMVTETSDPSEFCASSNRADPPTDLTEPAFFPDPMPQVTQNESTAASTDAGSIPDLTLSLSPSNSDPTLSRAPASDDSTFQLAQKTGKDTALAPTPILVRGFSDLDTLAIAAESAYDPYFQPGF